VEPIDSRSIGQLNVGDDGVERRCRQGTLSLRERRACDDLEATEDPYECAAKQIMILHHQ
jgi:hypothetical protein